jgi:hypothetical protein
MQQRRQERHIVLHGVVDLARHLVAVRLERQARTAEGLG